MDTYGLFKPPGNSHLSTSTWGTGPHRDSREGQLIFRALKPPWTPSHLQNVVVLPWHLAFHPLSRTSYFGEVQRARSSLTSPAAVSSCVL